MVTKSKICKTGGEANAIANELLGQQPIMEKLLYVDIMDGMIGI